MKDLPSVKISRQRLYQQVAQQLQEMILDGELKPGDKLPPERQMAEQMGVSRTVIREAVKTLEQRGLVKVLTGDGTYVSQIDPGIVSESLGRFIRQRVSSFEDPLDNLSEVRRMLEIEIAGLAADRAQPEDVAAMEEALMQMESAAALPKDNLDRMERWVAADLAFHNTLAQASQNPLLPMLLEPMSSHLLEFRRMASSAPGAMEDALNYHRKLLERVRTHEASACRDIMREHLEKAAEWARLIETTP